MQRRQWTNEKKALIVLSGLKSQSVASICNEHGISQSQYYQWKDQFLANASKAFEVEKVSTKQARLECENQKLKGLVGELTLELKKARDSHEKARLRTLKEEFVWFREWKSPIAFIDALDR